MLGFTLLELLAVIAIIGIMVGLVGPAFNAIRGAGNVTSAATEISSTMEQARAYAMSKKTYTYVGFLEGDGSDERIAPGAGTVGKVIVAVAAANDGSQTAITQGLNPGAGKSGLVMVSKLRFFNNMHLADLGTANAGRMARPSVPPEYSTGNTAFQTSPAANWTVNVGQSAYKFSKIIQISPQGSASTVTTNQGSVLARRLEIALQQAHGNQVVTNPSASNPGNIAALQIDGLSGAVTFFRP